MKKSDCDVSHKADDTPLHLLIQMCLNICNKQVNGNWRVKLDGGLKLCIETHNFVSLISLCVWYFPCWPPELDLCWSCNNTRVVSLWLEPSTVIWLCMVRAWNVAYHSVNFWWHPLEFRIVFSTSFQKRFSYCYSK